MSPNESSSPEVPPLEQQLEHQIRLRTGQRVRNLTVEIGSEGIVLRGRATSYYIRRYRE